MKFRHALPGTGAALAVLLSVATAQADKLPNPLAWTAYDVGSLGYNHSVAIGSALKNKHGITLRVLPGKNDVARLAPMREDKVQFSATGIGVFPAVEGTDTFAMRDWGPQDLYMVANSSPDSCITQIVGGKSGIRTLADLKGKRVAYIKGAASANLNSYSYIRFAGLEWEDVVKVEYAGVAAAVDGLIQGQVDMVNVSTTAGWTQKVFASPNGGHWPPVPHDDVEGWKRMRAVAPYQTPHICKEGAGVTQPFQAANYPYPVLAAYGGQDAEMVYEMTRLLYDVYPDFKDSSPAANGWGLDRQVFDWVVPVHDGAIRYYKEAGVWTSAAQKHDDALRARLALVRSSWSAFLPTAPEDSAAFVKGWLKAREAALTAAGLPPIWTAE